MKRLRDELAGRGVAVNFVIVNIWDGWGSRQALTSLSDLPVYNDAEEVKVWERLGGAKDDLLVYDASGRLAIHLPGHDAVPTDLRRSAGRAAVAAVLREVAARGRAARSRPRGAKRSGRGDSARRSAGGSRGRPEHGPKRPPKPGAEPRR